MKKLFLSVLVVAIAVVGFVGLSNHSASAEEMVAPCTANPTGIAGHSEITYTNEGGIPIVGYRILGVCGALDYKWTTNTGYTVWTTHPRMTSDASIFGCGAAWISVQARFPGGGGFSTVSTKAITVNCLVN